MIDVFMQFAEQLLGFLDRLTQAVERIAAKLEDER